MLTEVLMPKLGLTMTEGTIEEWKFKEGDVVKKGDILFSVSTDKLTNDIESDTDGVLLKILAKEGTTVECKKVIAYIGESGDIPPSAENGDSKKSVEKTVSVKEEKSVSLKEVHQDDDPCVRAMPKAKKLAKEKGYDLSKIVGTGPRGVILARDVENYVAGPKTSPMAAKLAAEYGVDLKKLDVDGRVMKADVMAALNKTEPEAVPVAAVLEKVSVEMESNDLPPVKVDPLRRSIAANMSVSWATSPRVTYTRPVDATEMKKLRESLKENLKAQGVKLTYNHILMKVVAQTLMEFPDVNASFANDMLTQHKHANVGLAVAKGDGLLVPNVKCAEMKSLKQIAQETESLIEATRAGKLAMEDMTGGTFTISSLGPYGITSFSPIINQPELAILGVCDIVDTPVVRNGQIVIRPMMNLSLTADHRVVDGVKAGKFLKRVAELLENPYLMLV